MRHTYCYYIAYQEKPGVYSSQDKHVAMCRKLSDARKFAQGRYYVVGVRDDGRQHIYINN